MSLLEICGYEAAGIMNSAPSFKVGHFFFKLIYLCFRLLSIPVKVCNCTELGYCYTAPAQRNHAYGMGPTIGILVGVLGFCSKHDKPEAVNIKLCNLTLRQYWLPLFSLAPFAVILFVIVVKRIKKKNKKRAQATAAEEEKNAMM